ncbi:MAG: hypothetical protein EOP36_01570 [Rubrivivax sp.]|nr:MAG: hypothetical protein EOP36_01570 [Rubrivivax sp.]
MTSQLDQIARSWMGTLSLLALANVEPDSPQRQEIFDAFQERLPHSVLDHVYRVREVEDPLRFIRQRAKIAAKRHKVTAGNLVEERFQTIVQDALPHGYRVILGGGYTYYSDEAAREFPSTQQDLLVVDRSYPVLNYEQRGYPPLESLVAIFEIKTTLSQDDVRQAARNAYELKRRHALACKSADSLFRRPLMYGLLSVGYDFKGAEDPVSTIVRTLANHTAPLDLNFGVVDAVFVANQFCTISTVTAFVDETEFGSPTVGFDHTLSSLESRSGSFAALPYPLGLFLCKLDRHMRHICPEFFRQPAHNEIFERLNARSDYLPGFDLGECTTEFVRHHLSEKNCELHAPFKLYPIRPNWASRYSADSATRSLDSGGGI